MAEILHFEILRKHGQTRHIRDGRQTHRRAHQVGWDIPLHFDTNPESLRGAIRNKRDMAK